MVSLSFEAKKTLKNITNRINISTCIQCFETFKGFTFSFSYNSLNLITVKEYGRYQQLLHSSRQFEVVIVAKMKL